MKLLNIIVIIVVLYLLFGGISINSLFNNTEHYQMVKYKTCMPIAKLTLYTSSSCPHCINMKPEWSKFIKHVNSVCNFRKMLEIVHLEDEQIDDQSVQYIPEIRLEIYPNKDIDKRGKIMHMMRTDSPTFKKFGEIYLSYVKYNSIKAWKKHSLAAITKAIDADIVVVNETNLCTKEKFKLNDYKCFNIFHTNPSNWDDGSDKKGYGTAKKDSVKNLF